jgi:hypothetical protein
VKLTNKQDQERHYQTVNGDSLSEGDTQDHVGLDVT